MERYNSKKYKYNHILEWYSIFIYRHANHKLNIVNKTQLEKNFLSLFTLKETETAPVGEGREREAERECQTGFALSA